MQLKNIKNNNFKIQTLFYISQLKKFTYLLSCNGLIFLYPKEDTFWKLMYCSLGQVKIAFVPTITIDNSSDNVFTVALRNCNTFFMK